MKKINKVFGQFFSLEGSLFRYSLSYCFLFALLPGLIVALLLFQFSVLGVDELLAFLYHYVPEDLIKPFVNYIMQTDYSSVIALVVASVVPCFVASKSFYSFMLISAKEEGFVTSNILIRIKSFGLFVVFLASILGISLVTHLLKLHPSLSFGIGLVLLFWWFYRMLSFEKRPFHYGFLGAAFSTVAILIVSYGFIKIVSKFTSYSSMYGPLASLVMLFLVVYVVSCVVYFGYCLNLIYGKHKEVIQHKSMWFYRTGEAIITKGKSLLFRGSKK